MAMMANNNRAVSAIRVGETEVGAVYLGDSMLFPEFPDPMWLVNQVVEHEAPNGAPPDHEALMERIRDFSIKNSMGN